MLQGAASPGNWTGKGMATLGTSWLSGIRRQSRFGTAGVRVILAGLFGLVNLGQRKAEGMSMKCSGLSAGREDGKTKTMRIWAYTFS